MSAVVCAVDVEAELDRTWHTLTRRSEVGRWWGTPDQDIRHVAQNLTMYTGPDSFYRLWIEELAPPRRLRFTTSYMGASPTSTVDCELTGTGDGRVRIRVREELPTDDGASIGLADDLWQERLTGLRALLEEGAPVDAPADLVEQCTLRAHGWRPLHPDNLSAWLPISDPGLPPRWLYVVDAEGSRPFPVTGWWARFDERLVVDIAVAPAGPPTRAELTVSAPGQQSEPALAVTHGGWDELVLDVEVTRMVRSRFRAMWRCALDRAALDGGHR